jgi:hypothetical protein
MKQTFELYLTGAGGREWFVALTCEPGEVVALARQTLADQNAIEAEVRQFGNPLFVVLRDGSSPS